MKGTGNKFKPHLQKACTTIFSLCMILMLTGMVPLPKHTPSNYEDRIRAYFRHQQWKQGGATLDSALTEYPAVAAFYELKGQYILHNIEVGSEEIAKTGKSKAYELARYYLIKSIDMDEKNLNSRRLLLKIDIETQQYSSAIVYCNELLEQSPYNEHLWRTKIDLYRKIGNDQEADRLLERLLTIYHDDDQLRKDLIERKTNQAYKERDKGNYQAMEQALRELINLDPTNAENYQGLFALLYRNGRIEEAAQVAEHAAQTVKPAYRDFFIGKRVGLLMEMNKYAEAQSYLKSKQTNGGSNYLQQLQDEVEIELARKARLNDPYEAYSMAYEQHKTQEVHDYLLGTTYQRNYYDDALSMVDADLKKNYTPKLAYMKYQLLKRMGYPKRAENTLRELYNRFPKNQEVAEELGSIYLEESANLIMHNQFEEAIPLLTDVYAMDVNTEMNQAARTRLQNCYIQTKRYDEAEAILDTSAMDMPAHKYCAIKAMLLNLRGQSKEALSLLATEYQALPDSMEREKQELSYSYEEIAVPYIKSLVAAGMTHDAWNQVLESLDICPKSNEILNYAISLSLGQRNEELAKQYIRQGMTTFPNDPHYKLKNAQLMINDKEYGTSIDSLRAMLDVYPGDSTIILAFTECSENMAFQHMKNHKNQEALAVLDTALNFNPESHTLLYTKSLVYRKMKDWKEAEKCLKSYKPNYNEYASHKRNIEEVANQLMRNNMTLEYQRARLGSEDAITGNAYLSYTRKLPRTNHKGEKRTDALNFGLAYAGRDGKANDDATASDLTTGGTGIMVSAAYEHQFSNRFTGRAEAGWSNRYFPTLSANASITYDMKRNWQLMARANFRWLKTYTGVYEMSKEFAGYNEQGDPLYANIMKQTGWTIKNKPMAQLGIGLGKTLGAEELFNVSGGVDGFMLSGNYYVNANAKMMFYPLQDKKSHLFAQAGLGTAPESSLIDQSLAVGFSDLNTFVSMGGQYFVNRYITLGLMGSWYTMLTQKETLSLPLNGTTAQTSKNYSNYFYVHASVILTF